MEIDTGPFAKFPKNYFLINFNLVYLLHSEDWFLFYSQWRDFYFLHSEDWLLFYFFTIFNRVEILPRLIKSIRNFLVNSNHDWSGEFESPELKLSDESIRKTKWRGGGARFKHSQLSATTRSWSAVRVFTANFDFIVKSWTDSVVLFSTQILFGRGILKWIRVQWSDYLIFVVKTANFGENKGSKFWFCIR